MRGTPFERRLALDRVGQERAEAHGVLQVLLADRQLVEDRLNKLGRRDWFKSQTGIGALDRAISTTRDMIVRMDDLVRELRRDAETEPALPMVTIETKLSTTSFPTRFPIPANPSAGAVASG